LAEQLSVSQQELSSAVEKYNYELTHNHQLNASINQLKEDLRLATDDKTKVISEMQLNLEKVTRELLELQDIYNKVIHDPRDAFTLF
jgi:hypothetical protein